MIRLIDNNKVIEISLREWDEENMQYGPDWAADFFEVGNLGTVEDDECAYDPAYVVRDVDYCVEQANDMVAGEGDFAGGPQSNLFVDVTELDRGAYPVNI